MQFDLLRPSICSLHNSPHQINGAAFVASHICSAESDRVGASSVDLQRQPRVLPVTDKANTDERSAPKEEEWIRVAHTRWREIVHERREELKGATPRRRLEINGEHRLSLSALPFKRGCEITD